MSTPSLLLSIARLCFLFSFHTVLFPASALRGVAPQGIFAITIPITTMNNCLIYPRIRAASL